MKIMVFLAMTVLGRAHLLTANDVEDKEEWIQVLKDACKIHVSSTAIIAGGRVLTH